MDHAARILKGMARCREKGVCSQSIGGLPSTGGAQQATNRQEKNTNNNALPPNQRNRLLFCAVHALGGGGGGYRRIPGTPAASGAPPLQRLHRPFAPEGRIPHLARAGRVLPSGGVRRRAPRDQCARAGVVHGHGGGGEGFRAGVERARLGGLRRGRSRGGRVGACRRIRVLAGGLRGPAHPWQRPPLDSDRGSGFLMTRRVSRVLTNSFSHR